MAENHHEVSNVTDKEGLQEMMRIVQAEGRNDVTFDELQKIKRVCDAERDSQKLISKTYSIRAPIGDFFSFLMRFYQFSMKKITFQRRL